QRGRDRPLPNVPHDAPPPLGRMCSQLFASPGPSKVRGTPLRWCSRLVDRSPKFVGEIRFRRKEAAFPLPSRLLLVPPSMATGLPFGARAERAAQTRVLRAALGAIRPRRPVAAFDIDSTILVNKVRQARIVREYGQLRGDSRLAACQPEAVVSWDLRDTLLFVGLYEP